ncbi:MAG TPA: diguanylate cyclase, partial [Humidesulfovibrio sp.]|uniref:diguanylate cyclase domain-containing protein n=1 Tax=Humidesulfovibrio sp. TaxID=2910988 RepID=UPI002BD8676B
MSATGLLRLYFLHFTLALADALVVEERIRLGVATAAFPSGRKYSVSAGVAALGPEDSVDSRRQRADTALYQAKNSGRDRVCA